MAGVEDRSILIRLYFHLGLSYCEITALLATVHRIVISERHLKRLLRRMGLFRRREFSDLLEVAQFITTQLEESGSLYGYRWMHLKCIQRGFTVQRETVRTLLKILDPRGVEIRRRGRLVRRRYSARGPNYLWHIDSYDKLKPYGICINGCIDGFSRKLLWLEAAKTNSDPRVIAGYFINSVIERGGTPKCIRGDMGTENNSVAQMQVFLRETDVNNRQTPFIYGTSQHNQRIESWWAILRRENTQFWMSFFNDIKTDNYFSGDFLDKALIQFCFLNIIKEELDEVRRVWNSHQIRISTNGPGGRPMILYNIPEVFGTRDYICDVELERVELCQEECIFLDDILCDITVYQLACMYMAENGWVMPNNPYEAADLYLSLRNCFNADL